MLERKVQTSLNQRKDESPLNRRSDGKE